MDKLRCRPGDIAILSVSDNYGKLVRVIERAPKWAEDAYKLPAWVIESLGSPINVVRLDTGTRTPAGSEMRTRTPDRCLIPLRDDPDEPKHAEVQKPQSGSRKVVRHG